MDMTAATAAFSGASRTLAQGSSLAADLWELFERCDVVSFDVFDTLLVRSVAKPTDVFEIVARQQGVPSFRKLRTAAEARARERKQAARGHPEVGLDEIYRELDKELRHRAAQLKAAELAAERLVLRPNPALRAIYEAAAGAGKTIVATSDVYLPAAFIEEILTEAGFPVAAVFASGELGKSKHKGDIFAHVADRLGVKPGRIVHVGDNIETDFKSALKAGCGAWHQVGNHERLYRDTRYNQGAISRLAETGGNLFASLVLAYLAACKAAPGNLFGADLFGRMYAGPMLLGFVRWVEHIRRLEGVKRLYLLARDGYVIDEALRIIGSDAELQVVYSSRRMYYIAVMEQDFEKTCLEIASTALGSAPGDVVKGLQFVNERELLDALETIIDIDREIADVQGIERFAKALRQCREILVRIARAERAALVDYLRPLRLTEPDAAVVDCGWALSGHRRLEMLAGGRIRGYYVGTIDHAYHHDFIRSFLFEKGISSPWKSIHLDAVELLELPFIAAERQTVRMEFEGAAIVPKFSTVDESVENVRNVFAGIVRREAMAFCRTLAPLVNHVRSAEAEDVLLMLFEPLARYPTSFEYFSLSEIPHTRAFVAHEVNTIGSFWRCSYNPTPTFGVTIRRGPWHYIRMGLLSLRRDGMVLTFYRARRKLLSLIGIRRPGFGKPPAG